jgi:hypothetical protein
MTRTVGLVAVVCLTSSVLGAENKETWKTYAPEGAGFSVLFPSEPTTGTIPKQEPPVYTAAIKRTAVDALSYQVTWSLRDKPFEGRGAAIIFVRAAELGAVKVSKGKLIRSKRITRGELEGREFVIEVSKDNVVRERIFAGGKSVYSLDVWGKDQKAMESPDAEKFFNSFKLGKEIEGTGGKK